MRAYLLTAPRWVLCPVYGLPFGLVLATAILWDNAAGALQVIGFGLVIGLLYGVLVTFGSEKERRHVLAVIGDVSPDQLRLVCRASRRGPVPDDLEVRASSSRLAAHDAAKSLRALLLTTPFSLLLAAGVLFRGDESPVFIVLAVLFAVGFGYQLFATRQLKHRARLLGADRD